MTMFTLTIQTENDAFQDGNAARELARLLRRVAQRLPVMDEGSGRIQDSNGNTVGRWELVNTSRED